ncbi:MAG: GTP cyclohydrolase II [Candidatus Paceibacterota bacterium]
MKNIKKDIFLIFGPPGSGKTAQSIFLSEQLKLSHISWGSIYRDKKMRNKYKKEIKKIDNEKTSVKNRSKLISSIIENEINKLTAKSSFNGLVLDGFPRRIQEAQALKKIIKNNNFCLKAVIKINPSLEKAIFRYNNRYVCEKCKRYFIDFVPSKKGIYCSHDGGVLKKIKTPIEIIKRDFFSYVYEIDKVIDYLNRMSETYFSVSGDDDDIVIFSNILLKIINKTKSNSKIYKRKSASLLETIYGTFKLVSYQSQIDYKYHLALVKGNVRNKKGVVTRVHSSCITGDIFGSCKCDCGEQLHEAMTKINNLKNGVIIYTLQEGRGINIINKINAYRLQRKGLDTVEANEVLGFPAELRNYDVIKEILDDLGIKSIILLTNNPDKIRKLTDLGIIIEDIQGIEMNSNKHNKKYLLTKKKKMNHKLKII